MVTAGTYRKVHLFKDGPRLRMLHDALLSISRKHSWQLEAWAVFPNHYHFIAHSPCDNADSLPDILRELHARTARWINRHDRAEGRQVWHNYRETRLTYERAYLARLNYVHHNAVHHALVPVANQYPWCSARWFEKVATPAQVRTIYEMKTNRINVIDDWTVKSGDWAQ